MQMQLATPFAIAPNRRRWAITPQSAPYVLLAPFLVLFLIFGLLPLCFSLFLVFQSWEPTAGLATMQFVGLGNVLFTLQDEWFWKSVYNTFWLAVASGVPQHLVAIPLACVIHGVFKRTRNAAIGAYFLPYITSTVAIAIMFSTLFSTDYGLVNQVLAAGARLPVVGSLFPDQPTDWLGREAFIKPAIAFVVFWRYVGFNTVLYLAALQTIPKDLYEAATIDGANTWRQFWHITLPNLKPMIFFGVTLTIIGGMQLFEEPFILTGGRGGTDQAGMTTAMYMYRTAFEFNDFGAASAMSWLLFLCVAALTWVTNRAFKSKAAE
jgi:multiple sugar transport system permease protein